MNKGKLRACGSSLFLKNHLGAFFFLSLCRCALSVQGHSPPNEPITQNHTHSPLNTTTGVGYSLTIEKRPEADAARIQRFVLNRLPEARLLSCVGAEISFQLPRQAAKEFKVGGWCVCVWM